MRLAAVIRSEEVTLRVTVGEMGWRVLGPDGHTLCPAESGAEAMSIARSKLDLEHALVVSETLTENPYEVFDLWATDAR
jgi:hypothetical protein